MVLSSQYYQKVIYLNTVLALQCSTNIWREKSFPDQAASDADLTAADGYFFGHVLTKKKKAFDFGGFFFSVLLHLVFTVTQH